MANIIKKKEIHVKPLKLKTKEKNLDYIKKIVCVWLCIFVDL